MCGIAGIVSNHTYNVQQQPLQQMLFALQHRGPNSQGLYINPNNTVGFAHKRLSIIDLSMAATQPMHKQFASKQQGALGNNLCIVFNGEIYNYIELRNQLQKQGYHFTTQSDTEVLLALYDCYNENCLSYIDGMFAFAIWNETTKQLFAARDRFGEKPFYYFFNGEKFLFASEMKALWAAGIAKQTNNSMLLNYLALGFTSNPNNAEETFYSQIKKLPAAHCLLYSLQNSSLKVSCYWQLQNNTVPNGVTEKEATEKLYSLLQQSISKRLRSDVAIGTSLSGGLDSSSIVSLIHQNKATALQTFSAVFPGFAKDESAYIQQTTTQFSLQNFTTTPTAKNFADDFEKLLYHQEEPFQSSSIYAQYKVYELAKQQNVTVILDGQGADEILAGYTKYYHWYWHELIKTGKLFVLLKETNAAFANKQEVDWGLKNYAAAILPKMAAKHITKKLQKQLLQNNFIDTNFLHTYLNENSLVKPTISNLTNALHYNTCIHGLEDLLRYADRNSMAHGIEVRLPFLNTELVEFVFSLPSNYKIKNGFTKYILRKAMHQYLPQEIVWKKEKIGFEPPQQLWLQNTSITMLTQQALQKLIDGGVLKKQLANKQLTIGSAHDENNMAWRVLCAGSLL